MLHALSTFIFLQHVQYKNYKICDFILQRNCWLCWEMAEH